VPKRATQVLISREPMAAFWNLICPAGATGFISFMTFAISADNLASRMANMITLVLTMVAFKFVISDKIPAVPYLTVIDKYTLGVFAIFVEIIFLQTICSQLYQHYEQAVRVFDIFSFVFTFLQFIYMQVCE
jgi:hypothetical protein